MSDFSKQKSHEENIQVSIDKILGTNSVLKRAKKTAEDHRKALFCATIEELQAIEFRDCELDTSFYLDLSKYNSPFYSVINSLFKLSFTEPQVDLIYFYLYERITPEGYIREATDPDGNVIDLSNPEKLYIELLKMK